MTYFYNPPKVIQGLIPSHRLPLTHPQCLVTHMTLFLLRIPSSSSKFELFPPNPKFSLLEDIFIPSMLYFHSSAIASVISSNLS